MRHSKWIDQIVELQQPDGSWGCFHTLSRPTKAHPMTTEQALRRLKALGMTLDDGPIHRAVRYMKQVLNHRIVPPDGREQVLNWDAFEQMMMAVWIRQFAPCDEQAMDIARFWVALLDVAFASGQFDSVAYEVAYRERIPKLHAKERLIGVPQFYMVALLWDVLDVDTERAFVDHIINNSSGIYYIYDSSIADVPTQFASLNASRYLGAIECLAGYRCAGEKLKFAVDWIVSHKDDSGWDMGASVKDGIYFPISDSWRKAEWRRDDCTARIEQLLRRLGRV